MNINFIREHPREVEEGAAKKNIRIDTEKILKNDKRYRSLLQEVEKLRAEQNALNADVARQSDAAQKKELIAQLSRLKEDIKKREPEMEKLRGELDRLVAEVPNLPFPHVSVGKDDTENKVLRTVGQKTVFDFASRDYMAIAEALDIIDTERAAKVSGSRFGYLKNGGALLEIALINYVYSIVLDEGRVGRLARKIYGDDPRYAQPFAPIIPPVLIKPAMMAAMGYTERGGDEIYYIPTDDLYLVGTCEQSIGPMHQGEIFDEHDLPIRYIGFSSSFRREAGSYGKDTKGILRVHQFDKLEMFSFCRPEDSVKEHQLLLALEEEIMQGLGIPYQVIDICSGDLGDSAAQKYDIEAWVPSENKYRETHSTSNTTDFQSERLHIKYRDRTGKTELVHMLNGTASAMGRMIIAIIENFQQADGSVRIPEVLQATMRKKEITKK